MSSSEPQTDKPRDPFVVQPTLRIQCWSFIIGASLFAFGSAPGISDLLGTVGANVTFFIGALFFTTGAFLQLQLAGPPRTDAPGRGGLRALWLGAAVQFVGTLLFNVSTGAALHARGAKAEFLFVWTPNAEGSVAFLVSACLLMLPLARNRQLWRPRTADWASTWLNMFGSIAFGVSAVGAVVLASGDPLNPALATGGTFVGALFFVATSVVLLPTAKRQEANAMEVS